MELDETLTPEVQTDKDATKVVPCLGCGRPLVVNVFYAPAKARCSECRADAGATGAAEVVAPVPGRTDPATAVDLAKCLVNPQFARALCPVHPEDEDHEMVIKMITHSEHYGPNEFIGYKEGKPVYRQLAPGETVTHQCRRCRATVVYSTTAQVQFRQQNDARPGGPGINGLVEFLGAEEEDRDEVA